MASTGNEQELEEKLLEAGNKLVDPPTSIDELLHLLDRVESCLLRIEQSPTKSMLNALSPSLKALIADTLLKHVDVDVKVIVASCISEIIRITAPEAPYDDDKMKEVFQLIVSSFENLHDKLSRSYTRRTSMLETISKFHLCVVMLDLECDDLILKMFQHFLKAIRDHHPESVFSYMKTIMILVLKESEDISLDLLSPILESVKIDNEEVLPIARRLGESVLESCATNLRPYLKQAVYTLGISLDDYSNVLASICQDTIGSLKQNDASVASDHEENKSKLGKEPIEESKKVDAEEVAPPQQDNYVGDRSPQLVISNEQKSRQSIKKRGRKPSSSKSLISSTKGYDEELVGTRVKVWWPEDQMFYKGIVGYFYTPNNMHQIVYDDGDEEILILKDEKWEVIESGDDPDKEEGTDGTSLVASADLPPKKKGKISAGEFKKEGKRNSSSKSGRASSSKPKGGSVKFSKSKYGSKSKNMDSSKMSKSKDVVSTTKTSAKTRKSKQEASMTTSSSKAKSTKSGGKFNNSNDTCKVKANLLRTEDSDNEDPEDYMEGVEKTKGKTSSSSKAKSGKKRRRN